MTRTFTKKSIWTWVCDNCGAEESLARTQTGLPEKDQMRQQGWFIAELFGDLCPRCNAELGETE